MGMRANGGLLTEEVLRVIATPEAVRLQPRVVEGSMRV